ncbi:MAG TPA: bifunctional RNase H/acid phosphatase [Kineosporiaceae bacterium]
MTGESGGRRFVVEADGGSRGNPGPAGYGALVLDAGTGELLAETAESIGRATNNVAEYRGLIAGLQAAVAIDPRCRVEVRMDSKLVVEQMSGRWQIKHDDLRALAARARGVLPPSRVTYTWIPRAENARADRLANEAMDAAAAGRAWSTSTRRSGAAGSGGAAATSSASVTAGASAMSVTAGASSGSGAATTSSAAPSPSAPPSRGRSRRPDSARAPQPADPGEPTVLLLVRHGRTPLTEQRRFSGRGGADPLLTDSGRADAARVADLLATLVVSTRRVPGHGSVDGAAALPDVGPVTAVVCSPLARTRETAAIVAGRLGLPVAPDDGWSEVGFGAWDGLTYAEVAERWPAELRAWQGSTTAAPPGGESLDEHVVRVRAARARLVSEHAGRTVAVVTHVTPVRVAVAEALDAGPAALWRTRVSPCSVSAIRYWSDGGAEVVAVNRIP